ncbi:MAG: ABC transporter ATP-binding protein [Candidatus Paceibacterota bacterium]|jgi:ABC-type multidrug transport system fused ATPase/permease subunit
MIDIKDSDEDAVEEIRTEPVSMREGIRGIWRHTRRYRNEFFVLGFLGFISAVANGAVPYITGRFFDALISLSQGKTNGGTFPFWALMLAIWAVIQVVANSIDWVMDRKRRTIDVQSHLAIQTEGFAHLFKLPLTYHSNEHINGVLSKISMAGWRISSIMQNAIQIGPQLLSVAIGIILAATISLPMAGVLAAGVLFYGVVLVFMLRPVATIDHIAHESWNEYWDDAAAAVQQVASVKQAAAEKYEIAKVQKNLAGKTGQLWHSLDRIWSNAGFFQRTIVFLTQLTVFVASASSVANGSMTVGELIALNGYALMFFGPFVALGQSWQMVQNGLTAAGQLERVFNEKEENYHPITATVPTEHSGRIAFDHVSFHYDADQAEVLSNMSFTVNPGEVIALVGESGGGKSTTVSLVSGYYFPSAGSVMVDGLDTRHWDLTDLRTRIAVVPQEVALFNDTIRNNICYGMFDATEEQIAHAAREAHIDEYITDLPNGYQTLVGERGIKLSVGQKQRIAIARAILRDPEILILDEPTSALDSETERFVTSALEKLMHNRTTFIIAHRLSTVRKAGKILVLKEGHIAESGSHDDLVLIEGGIYRHLYELHIGLHE